MKYGEAIKERISVEQNTSAPVKQNMESDNVVAEKISVDNSSDKVDNNSKLNDIYDLNSNRQFNSDNNRLQDKDISNYSIINKTTEEEINDFEV